MVEPKAGVVEAVVAAVLTAVAGVATGTEAGAGAVVLDPTGALRWRRAPRTELVRPPSRWRPPSRPRSAVRRIPDATVCALPDGAVREEAPPLEGRPKRAVLREPARAPRRSALRTCAGALEGAPLSPAVPVEAVAGSGVVTAPADAGSPRPEPRRAGCTACDLPPRDALADGGAPAAVEIEVSTSAAHAGASANATSALRMRERVGLLALRIARSPLSSPSPPALARAAGPRRAWGRS